MQTPRWWIEDDNLILADEGEETETRTLAELVDATNADKALLETAPDLAAALDSMLSVTFDAMRAQGYTLSDDELAVEAQAREALAKARPETP